MKWEKEKPSLTFSSDGKETEMVWEIGWSYSIVFVDFFKIL